MLAVSARSSSKLRSAAVTPFLKHVLGTYEIWRRSILARNESQRLCVDFLAPFQMVGRSVQQDSHAVVQILCALSNARGVAKALDPNCLFSLAVY